MEERVHCQWEEVGDQTPEHVHWPSECQGGQMEGRVHCRWVGGRPLEERVCCRWAKGCLMRNLPWCRLEDVGRMEDRVQCWWRPGTRTKLGSLYAQARISSRAEQEQLE